MNNTAPIKILNALRAHVEEAETENPEALMASFFRVVALSAHEEGIDSTDVVGGMIVAIARLMANEPGLEAVVAGSDIGQDVRECIEFFQACPPESAVRH
jgi:hypothetical protein